MSGYLVSPLGLDRSGLTWSLYLQPRGSDDVPVIVLNGSAKVQADLFFAAKYLGKGVCERWAGLLTLMLELEQQKLVEGVKAIDKDHQKRLRGVAQAAITILRRAVGQEEAAG